MKKRFISFIMALCFAVFALPPLERPAFAQLTKREDWNGKQRTSNLIPKLKEGDTLTAVGWKNIGDQITLTAFNIDNGNYNNQFGIRARTLSDDIGNKDYTGGVYWQVNFSDEDKVKINKGDIYLNAAARYWFAASTHHYISLRFEFFDANNVTSGDSYKKTFNEYYVFQTDVYMQTSKVKIPENTAYVKIWFSNWGSTSARPFIGDMSARLFDETAPKPVGTPSEYSVNGSTALPLYTVPGDKVTYALKFDEAVTVSNVPTLGLSTGSGVSCDVTYSADRQTVYLTAALANTGKNEDLKLKKISGLSVADDSGNVFNYSNSSLNIGSLSYKSVFNVTGRLTNMQLSGAAAARYGEDYQALLKPSAGYKVPDNVSVKVKGVSVSGYTYDKLTGKILIKASEICGDIEIAASAVPQTYTVTFDMQGGSGGTNKVSAAYLQAMPAVTPPSKAGYTFGGYFTETGGGGIRYYNYDGKATRNYDKPSDVTLYAKWSAREYTVTLDAAGGTGSGTVTAVYDADMPSIVKPVKKGYTFLGYFTQQNGGGERYYNADGTSAKRYDKTDGLMLYAGWSANSYTVTFDMQGGSGGTASTDVVYDNNMPSVTPPSRTGYTFAGYFEKADGGAQYYYANGEGTCLYDKDASCTLYAHWTANTYDVVLNAQGGSGGSAFTAVFGSDMPVIAAPDKPGYLFGGYFEKENGGGTKYYNADCSSASVYNKAEGMTLYALWTPITYNIQLYSKGENVGTLKDVVYGELRVPSAEELGISYPNHRFVGWNMYDEQNWAMYTAGRTYAAGLVTEQGKTAYVYAAWLEKDKYTVTYDANGGEGAPSAVEVHADETIRLSSAVPARKDYTFVGWSENSVSDSAQYQPNDSFTMGNSLVTLFAIWRKNPELSYNANGGVFSTYAGVSYPAAGSLVTLTGAVPQRNGYIFRGWAESKTATVAEIVHSPYTMPDSDTVLYAVFEPVRYTVNVFAAEGYSVSGIDADGYMLGEYAEFTVSGAAPKVYINGALAQPLNGKYRFEIRDNSSVTVSDTSALNVIYNANGGVNAPVDMRIYANGEMASVKTEKPVRTGYTFIGWAAGADLGYAQYTGGENIPVTAEDIVLYAVWEPVSYRIKYDAGGGSGDMAATEAVYDRELTLSPNLFAKTGCQFAGWSYDAGGELAYAGGAKVKNLTDVQNGEITLYAVWNGAKTKINFNFEGGSSGTPFCVAEYGNPLPADKLAAPCRYGYIFAGYYTLKNKGGNLVYNADMTPADSYRVNPWNSVANEFDLYAAWEPVSYTVAFVNGTETLNTLPAVYGDIFRLPTAESLGISVPNGYSFDGWSVAAGSDTVYYRDGQEIAAGLAGENGAVVCLYAVIRRNESFTVTLPSPQKGYKIYYNNLEVTSQKDITVSRGDDISFTVCIEDGYSSDKMTVSANGIMLGAVQINGSNYTYNIKHISADTSVNIYHVKKETFRIMLNDGTGYSISPKNTVVENGDSFSFTVTLADGYKTAAPVVFVNGNTLTGTRNGDAFTYTVPDITSQPVISVAVAKRRQHTVTFISNGSIYSIAAVEENMKIVQPDTPERSGYTFGGWYKDAACIYPYDFQTGAAEDIKLYAKWTADTYDVEYNKNTDDNVAVPSGQTKKHDSVLILNPQIPSRTGYNFAAWNTKADGTGTSYAAGSELSVNADITLYAQWKIKKFAVSFITGEGVSGTISANEAEYNGTVTVTAVSGSGFGALSVNAIPEENAELISEGVYRITGAVSFVASATVKEIFTANFYYDNGLYYTQSALDGSAAALVLPNPPSKPGYSFIGWYTEQTGGIKIDETMIIDKNLSVYARFAANTLNVIPAQSGEGYTVESTDSTTVHYGGEYSFTITMAEHYNADNMKVYANGILLSGNADGGVYSYSIKNITADQVITVTGTELDKHTITYMFEGQVYLTVQSDYNSFLTEPVSPAKQGEVFKGWSDGQRFWNFSEDRVTSDMTLCPIWESGILSVTPAQSGEGYTVESTDSTTVNYGGEYTFTITVADHYNADNMRVYANGILLVPEVNGRVYKFAVRNIADDVVIFVYGVKADIYTVRYIADGEAYYSEKVAYGDRAQKPKTPVKEGHIFAGWFAGENEWDFASGVERDLELEAKFETLAYYVTVPGNRDEFTVDAASANPVEHGGSFKFSITVADGYNAADLMVYANGALLEKTAENGSTVYYELLNITEAKVITVRGIGQNTYSVAYSANIAEYVGNMPQNTVKAYGADINISDMIPERYGYDFEGWSTEKDGAVQYSGGEIYSENADIKLYAVWKAKKFAVAFETNGGVINSGEIAEYTYGTGARLPEDVSKNGYTFAGWYEDELMQGVRVYEIKDNDFGDKTYYAAYTMANVNVCGYTGEYDGSAHDISYTLADNLSVEKYQWYFVPGGSDDAVPVSSAAYNTYSVKNAAESGEYYCYVEALLDGYVIRFFTERATVAISRKPVCVKAADGSKVYDAKPLTAGGTELIGGCSTVNGHRITAVMTSDSTITNAGTVENKIERIVISDSDNADVTDNYEITMKNGTLSITPLPLAAVPKNIRAGAGSVLDENSLYEVSGALGNEKLTLANISVTAENENGEGISFKDVTKSSGTYTVTINYSGFNGDGSENYSGSGTVAATVTVYRQSGGGGGGGRVTASEYRIDFDTNGGSKAESQSVKSGGQAKVPQTPEMSGYIFGGWYSDKALTEEFDFNSKITKSITLYAKWTEIKQNEENPSAADPAKTGVSKMLETEKHFGYMNGYENNTFRPENNMTRAEAAQMFYNLLLDKNISGEKAFDDVNPGAWYCDAVEALANLGILKGIGGNRFNPGGEITRAEFIAAAMRFVDIDAVGSETFSDVSQDHWAAKDISAAASLGWISGNDDGTFAPDAFISRASAAKIVNNMLGRSADAEYIKSHSDEITLFSDVSPQAWYYEDVTEAANAHEYEKNRGIESWK